MDYRKCYSRLLYLAEKNKSSAIIENDSFADSADVYERFFLSCSKEVFILARGIREDIFSQLRVRTAAVSFLKKQNTKLKIILRARNIEEKNIAEQSLFLTTVAETFADKVELIFYQGDDTWLKGIGSTTIGDDRMYRYRYPQDEYRTTSNAEVCFNASEKCAEYSRLIESALAKATFFKPLKTF